MKYLFLAHDKTSHGGAQRCLIDLLKGLKQTDPACQIYLIAPGGGTLLEACAPYIDGYKIIQPRWWLVAGRKYCTPRRKVAFIVNCLKNAFKIMRYIRKVSPDCTMTNTIVIPQLAVASKFLGIKHIWFVHEIPTETWHDNFFIFSWECICRMLDKLSYKIIVPSEYAAEYYRKIIDGRKVTAVSQAVELTIPAEKPENSDRVYTVLLVGAFDSNKGQLELLQAVKAITEKGREISCLLVGGEADKQSGDACREFVAANRLENNVSFIPATQDVGRYYRAADIVTVCSSMEAFGRVAVEAQMCGLPLILSDVGANPERIEERRTGFLYRKGDVGDLVEKIELLRNPELRAEMSRNISRADLQKYTPEAFASEFRRIASDD